MQKYRLIYVLQYIRIMIRKCFLAVLVFLAAPSVLPAQVSVGVSAGPNLTFRTWKFQSSATPLDGIDYEPGLAGQAAFVLEYQAGAFALRGEMGYQGMSSRTDVEVADANGSTLGKGSLIETLHAWSGGVIGKITLLRPLQLYALAGTSFAYVQNGNRRLNKALANDLPDELSARRSFDLSGEYYNRNLAFLNAGAGTAFRCGLRGQLTPELRYQYGLSKISKATAVDATSNSLLLNAGYLFRL